MIFKRVTPGHMSPRFMGLVYIDHLEQDAVYCLMPFNLIFRLCWLIWIWLKRPLPIFDREQHTHEQIQKLKKEIKTLRQFAQQQQWEKMVNEPMWRTS